MSKNVLDLNAKQLEELKNDMKEGKYTLKEIAQRHGVEYSSLMYWMQRNRVTYDLKLANGTRIKSDDDEEEANEDYNVNDDLRMNIVKDMIIGDKVSTIANRYSLDTQTIMYELQNNCIPADFDTIRNNIDISRKDSIRFNTIAYIIANPKKKRSDFRNDSKFDYNKILESIYFLISLGILQKSDYVPIKVPNLFKTRFDSTEQQMFIEAVKSKMCTEELANMFNIEAYEVEKILQSDEFSSSLEAYNAKNTPTAKDDHKVIKSKVSPEKKEKTIAHTTTSKSSTTKSLEQQLAIKNLEIDKLKLEIEITKIKEKMRELERQEQDVQDKIKEIDDKINSMK